MTMSGTSAFTSTPIWLYGELVKKQALALAASAVFLGGCTSAASPTVEASRSDNPMPPAAAHVSDAIAQASTVHSSFRLEDGGGTVVVDERLGRVDSEAEVSAQGTTSAGYHARVRVLGADLYIDGSASYWREFVSPFHLSAADKQLVVRQLANRWVKMPRDAAFDALHKRFDGEAQFVALEMLARALNGVNGRTANRGGQRLVEYDAAGGSLFVPARPGSLLPRLVEFAHGETLTLTEWNKAFTVTAPKQVLLFSNVLR